MKSVPQRGGDEIPLLASILALLVSCSQQLLNHIIFCRESGCLSVLSEKGTRVLLFRGHIILADIAERHFPIPSFYVIQVALFMVSSSKSHGTPKLEF